MKNRKTILIFTDWYKPGFKAGGPVQSVYNLACLLSDWMDVRVVTRNTDLDSSEGYKDIQPNEWVKISEFHHVLYLDSSSVRLSKIRHIVKENKDNILYINGLFSLYFSFLPALLCTLLSCNSVFISVRGMLHRSALSVKPIKKQIFLAFARGFGLYAKPALIASNEAEKSEILRSFPKARVVIAPNIPRLPEDNSRLSHVFKANGMLKVLCIGRIAPEKNPITLVKALKTIDFPIQVDFCGGYNDKNYFEEFKSLLKALPEHIAASYLGEIPNQQIYTLLTRSDLMVMPSLGENFGHAIYESLVSSVPVIIGNNTPWKNVESLRAGLEIDPMDEKALERGIRRFNEMSEEDYQEWRGAARRLSEEYLAGNDFKDIYGKLFS